MALYKKNILLLNAKLKERKYKQKNVYLTLTSTLILIVLHILSIPYVTYTYLCAAITTSINVYLFENDYSKQEPTFTYRT